MDPLSISASVIAITTTCLSAIKTLNALRGKFQDAAVTITAICSESAIISATLSRLQSLLTGHEEQFLRHLKDRTELLATFDIAFLGCVAVFSCIQDEVERVTRGLNEQKELGNSSKLRLHWKEETMQEYLRQIRGQQTAVSLLLQILQTESTIEIQCLLHRNTAVLEEISRQVRSLRDTKPEINLPHSIIDSNDSQLSISAEEVWSTHGIAFDFDDVVLSSRAYQRAFRHPDSRHHSKKPSPASEDFPVKATASEQNRYITGGASDSETPPYFVDMSIVLGDQQPPSLSWIPEELSFYRVIANEVSPPYNLQNFMDFEMYVECCAENLQFYLWLRTYVERWRKLPSAVTWVSPPCSIPLVQSRMYPPATVDDPFSKYGETSIRLSVPPKSSLTNSIRRAHLDKLLASYHLDKVPIAQKSQAVSQTPLEFQEDDTQEGNPRTDSTIASEQPNRNEIARIVKIYFTDSGDRVLNLFMRERRATLEALAKTSHPSAFANVLPYLHWSLIGQSFPKFLRWTINNGDPSQLRNSLPLR